MIFFCLEKKWRDGVLSSTCSQFGVGYQELRNLLMQAKIRTDDGFEGVWLFIHSRDRGNVKHC